MKKIVSGILLSLFFIGSVPTFAYATNGISTSTDIASLLSQISALMRQIEELKAQAKALRGDVKKVVKEEKEKNHNDDDDDDNDRKEKKRRILVRCGEGEGVFPMKWNAANGNGKHGKHKGEWKKFYRYCKQIRNGTSTDTVAPSISSVTVSNISANAATVHWTTDENTNSVVAYGTTSNYGATSTSLLFKKNHNITLTGLSANTLYNFQVRSADLAGNLVISSNATFTTSATSPSDTTAPAISSITVSHITSSGAMIIWTTNESSDSQVVYGSTTGYGSTTTLDSTLVTSHSVALTGLSPSTLYHFAARSKDASSNLATSSDVAFATSALADAVAPMISAISATVGSTTATVIWMTNENANSKIYYSTVSPLVFGSASTLANASLLAAHSLALSSLSASTTYHYVVESADALNNISTSSQQSFTTGS